MSNRIDFNTIYATDLVYVPGCWQLCGDAHCCSFARHKDRFRLMGARRAQELPLLPGEYAYLEEHGYLDQFGGHDHRVVDYAFGQRSMRIESIVSHRPGCACAHATRTTVCRLYPFLPVLDADRRLLGVERLGVYDVLEDLEGAGHICQVENIPAAERPKFLAITDIISADPLGLFYVTAYRLAQDHVRSRLVTLKGDREVDYFSVFEMGVFRQRLVDHDALAVILTDVAAALEDRYGPFGLSG